MYYNSTKVQTGVEYARGLHHFFITYKKATKNGARSLRRVGGPYYHLNSATGIMHKMSPLVKPASHRIRGKGLANGDFLCVS